MSDKAAGQKARSPEGRDENGPAAALLLSHVSIQIRFLATEWRGGPGRIQNGTEARRLLSRLLLGIDGSFIRLWSEWRESISC
jgi:hypothetical protein